MYTDCFKIKKYRSWCFLERLKYQDINYARQAKYNLPTRMCWYIKAARDMTDSNIRIVSDSASVLQAQQNNEMKEMMLQMNTQA